MTTYLVYIGTNTTSTGSGIYAFRLNPNTGNLEPLGLAAHVENPPYLAISPCNQYLYSVMDTQVEGHPHGAVGAFSIDHASGRLQPINHLPLSEKAACHINTNSKNTYLLAANYKEGKVSACTIEPDGSLGRLIQTIEHHGSGPNIARQEQAHAHYVTMTPDEKHLCVADLGIDQIVIYDVSLEQLTHRPDLSIAIKPGSGPRHLTFHPNGKYVYLLTELTSELVVFEYCPDAPWKMLQTVSALPENYTGTSIGSAIHTTPDGQFVFAANRGHDSIAAYRIGPDSGLLTFIAHTPSQGKNPRDFNIDPSGKYLIVANMGSDSLASFTIDPTTGTLTAGGSFPIPSPTCVKFVK